MSSQDPLDKETHYVLQALSLQLEADLHDKGERPLLAILAHAREDAAAAISELLKVDFANAGEIRRLQNEANRYGDLVGYCRSIMDDGRRSTAVLREKTQDDLINLIAEEDAEALALVGIERKGPPVE